MQNESAQPNPKLIVALDFSSLHEISSAAHTLQHHVDWFKLGLEIFAAEGPRAIESIRNLNKFVFLDLKLHDIPRTVERSVAAAAKHNVNMLTIHASGGRDMIKAAANAAGEYGNNQLTIVAVTTLTSLNQADLTELGIQRPLLDHTLAIGQLAIQSGAHGLVCSPLEIAEFRRILGHSPTLVTPGIRSPDDATGDQKRTATPAQAVAAGSSFLVVGRPILAAPDPVAAAQRILAAMRTT